MRNVPATIELEWTVHQAPCHVWYWFYPIEVNGWRAMICDDSQSIAPHPPTRYTASIARVCGIQTHPAYISTLEEAKAIAVRMLSESEPCDCFVCQTKANLYNDAE